MFKKFGGEWRDTPLEFIRHDELVNKGASQLRNGIIGANLRQGHRPIAFSL
jgi:hypothetical protein